TNVYHPDLCFCVSVESCDSPLVSALPQSAFSSSSELSNSHGPGFAKLNRRDGAGGWSPLDSNKYQWLEIKLEQRTEITAIATQGRYGSSDWVTRYLLMFSDTGHNWRPYRQEDSIGAFSGNSNADSVVMYKLQQPVIAQYVRILPLDWNPNGRIGLRLEAYGCQYKSDVVSFDGSAHLLFRPDPSATPANRDVLSMNFKTLLNSGTLVHMEERSGHTLTLELFRGKLLLQLRKGRGSSADFHPLVSLGSLLDDQHWHHVSVERVRGLVNFTVDKNTQQFQLPDSISPGNVSFTCTESIDVPVTFASPGSFLALPWVSGGESVSVALQFRTWNKAGLLMTFDLQHNAGTLWLYLSEARARLQIHKTGRIMTDITAGASLNDGQWHSLELAVRRGRLAVTLDRTDSSTASTSFPVAPDSQLFLGGCPETEHSSCRNPFSVFQGCMRLIRTDAALVDLIRVQQMLFGNFSDLQMDMCGIVDRCSPSRCEHGGRCSQSWSTFHCNCSATGYSGATCHSSIYEASCEAYKHKGNTSGFYYIDVDGSGPIKPQLIYCNISDKAWMVIQHNNTELTKLKVSSGINQHLAHFNYSADVEQIQAIITQAEYCEQELSYHCKKSRLLNTPDGAPFSWWVGQSGEAHMYWGGAVPGSQQCACGLQENCVHPEHFCNCDADSKEWSNDSGLLSHKEHLPVRALTVGDINRSGSEAAYRVGPLQCYGDRGTASRQKGFLGCIRSLKLNGKTLDLEERAEITPGVTPGCPGHCSSYGDLCQNHGSCVEDHSGFTCDCSLSPFTGTFCHKDVSAFFKPGTSVTYTFKEPYELNRNVSAQSSSIYSDLTLKGENVSLSFRTSQAPALLLYVSSYYREFLAVLLNRNGHLDVRYKLQHNRDAEVFRASGRNLANGLLHRVSVQRLAETLSIQVLRREVDPEIARLNALGFTGCLSVVQFNSISPLKAALLYPDTSPVIVTGPLSESSCGSSLHTNPYAAETTHSLTDHVGSVNTGEPIVNAINSDSALIGGVIAVVIFVSLAALAVMARFLYRRKETFQPQEPKAGKTDDSPETPFNTDPNSQSIISDNQKEYFI
uniref:Contactin associated protein like 3 n=1 Tax=Cyprinus carpio TaxID=7962 RepID=A0A8C2Q5Y0_CYPCA